MWFAAIHAVWPHADLTFHECVLRGLQEWKSELSAAMQRVKRMRGLLQAELEKKGTPGTWGHITSQIGMFSYTGACVQSPIIACAHMRVQLHCSEWFLPRDTCACAMHSIEAHLGSLLPAVSSCTLDCRLDD